MKLAASPLLAALWLPFLSNGLCGADLAERLKLEEDDPISLLQQRLWPRQQQPGAAEGPALAAAPTVQPPAAAASAQRQAEHRAIRPREWPRLQQDHGAPAEEAAGTTALRLQLHQQLALAGASSAHTPAWVIVVAVIAAIIAVLALSVGLLLLWRADLRRVLDFWWRFRTIIREYRQVMNTITDPDELKKALEPLHKIHGPKIAENLAALGGMYVKAGQYANLQPDIPKTIREHLRVLHDACRPLETSELRGIVEAELRSTEFWRREGGRGRGSAIEQVFCSFEEKPLGVASIGQVHKARLRENAQDVVVKVQFPYAKAAFETDLWCVKNTIELFKGSKNWTYTAVCEIEEQLAQEFDFQREASNIDAMRTVLLPAMSSAVELPEVRHDLTTNCLITMSFLEGVRLDRAIARKLEDAGLGDVAKVLRLSSGDEARPPGLPGEEAEEAPEATDVAEKEAFATADCQRVVQTLFDVWGRSLVRAGVFNADPHPGNVLLMPDGRLGLLDFGQVKHLSGGCRKAIADTIMGLLRADVPFTAKMLQGMGIHVKLEDSETRLWYHASIVFERRGMLPMLDECWGKDGGSQASEMVFVVRSLGLLRGVAMGLGFPMSPAESWGQWAAETAEEEREVEALVKDARAACCSGTYDLLEEEGCGEQERRSVGTFTLHHAQGSLWFGGTWSLTESDGKRSEHKVEYGFLCGRSIEMKAGSLVIRGIIRENGDRISHIRTWDRLGEDGPSFTAVRTSGAMGRAFNSLKAKAAAAVMRLAPAATKAKIMQAAVKSAQSFEQSPEG